MSEQQESVFYCTVCTAHSTEFLSYGNPPRKNAKCPNCMSLERHRLMWLYIERILKTNENNKLDVLHIAPEKLFFEKLNNENINYITCDLNMSEAAFKIDLTNIPIRDNKVDLIICSHVLEHIVDDTKAISELYRILRNDGIALIMVPIRGETTYEDFSIITSEERNIHFGQWDHVRMYGSDIVERLTNCGFEVIAEPQLKTTSPLLMTLSNFRNEKLFYCVK